MYRIVPVSLLALLLITSAGFAQMSQPVPSTPLPPVAAPLLSAAHLANPDEVRRRLGLSPEYDHVSGIESLKIAVLDYGFEGIESNRPYLPHNAVVVEHYDPEFVRRHDLGDPEFR